MRVIILTSLRYANASQCLPLLVEHPDIEVARIVFCDAHFKSRRRMLRSKLKKIRRIGPLGALTGVMIRPWFAGTPAEDLFALAERYGVPVEHTPRTNAPRTRELFEETQADLGLSLGNAYIAPRVYSIPRFGMINTHGEILPRFQGAQSVIWPIYEDVWETGFTIHQVDRGIDTGAILHRHRFPIEVRPTLGETVRLNIARISEAVPPALVDVVANYEKYLAKSSVQSGGTSYTTPTLWQMLRMRRNHRRRLRRQG